jgi:two-component system, sensor histidine kinase and response regulator
VPEVLDQSALARLLEMVGGDPDFVDELVDTFLGDAPQQLAELRTAVATGTAADAVRPAHTLKGTAGAIGARTVEATSRAIEQQAGGGSVDGLDDRVTELERALADLEAALADARARRWKAALATS